MLSLVTLYIRESVVLKFVISGVTLTTGHKSLELGVSSKYILLCLCLCFLLVILCLLSTHVSRVTVRALCGNIFQQCAVVLLTGTPIELTLWLKLPAFVTVSILNPPDADPPVRLDTSRPLFLLFLKLFSFPSTLQGCWWLLQKQRLQNWSRLQVFWFWEKKLFSNHAWARMWEWQGR